MDYAVTEMNIEKSIEVVGTCVIYTQRGMLSGIGVD